MFFSLGKNWKNGHSGSFDLFCRLVSFLLDTFKNNKPLASFYVMCWPKFDQDVNALIEVLTVRLLTKTKKTKKNTATVQMEFHI